MVSLFDQDANYEASDGFTIISSHNGNDLHYGRKKKKKKGLKNC